MISCKYNYRFLGNRFTIHSYTCYVVVFICDLDNNHFVFLTSMMVVQSSIEPQSFLIIVLLKILIYGICTWCLLRFRFVNVSGEILFRIYICTNTKRFVLSYLGLTIDLKYNIIIAYRSTTKLDIIHLLYDICTFLHFTLKLINFLV